MAYNIVYNDNRDNRPPTQKKIHIGTNNQSLTILFKYNIFFFQTISKYCSKMQK